MTVKLTPLIDVETFAETKFIPTVRFTPLGQLEIKISGLGDNCSQDGEGVPLLLEVEDGVIQLKVWGDINQEEPTQIINLAGAIELNRV